MKSAAQGDWQCLSRYAHLPCNNLMTCCEERKGKRKNQQGRHRCEWTLATDSSEEGALVTDSEGIPKAGFGVQAQDFIVERLTDVSQQVPQHA